MNLIKQIKDILESRFGEDLEIHLSISGYKLEIEFEFMGVYYSKNLIDFQCLTNEQLIELIKTLHFHLNEDLRTPYDYNCYDFIKSE